MPAAFIGLQVTETPPHSVVAVEDLVDVNFVRQGAPGYANPVIRPHDRILQIDGVSVGSVSVDELRMLLGGELNSPVSITLARAHGQGKHYSVTVLRHREHDGGKRSACQARSAAPQPLGAERIPPTSFVPLREQLQAAQRDVSAESPDVPGRDVGLKTVILLDAAGNSLADPVFRR
jgi:hypothetical protein